MQPPYSDSFHHHSHQHADTHRPSHSSHSTSYPFHSPVSSHQNLHPTSRDFQDFSPESIRLSPDSNVKRKRIQQACRPCGVKRVKCDGGNPCSTCLKAGEPCEYGQPKKRGPPKGSTRGGSKAAKRAIEAAAVSSHALNLEQKPSTHPFFPNRSNHVDELNQFRSRDSVYTNNNHHDGSSLNGYKRSEYDHHYSKEQPADFSRSVERLSLPPLQSISHHGAGVADLYIDSGDPLRSSASGFDPRSRVLPIENNLSSRSYDSPYLEPRSETFYRGSSSGLGILRAQSSDDRRLPPLYLWAGRVPSRSSSGVDGVSTSFVRNGARKTFDRTPLPSSWSPSLSESSSSRDYRNAHPPPERSLTVGQLPSSSPPQTANAENRFIQTSLSQIKIDKEALQLCRPLAEPAPNLEPFLYLEPDDGSGNASPPLQVTLSSPEIPLAAYEKLFLSTWAIVMTVWPALYKPALSFVPDTQVIDSARHPFLVNALCALASLAWDSSVKMIFPIVDPHSSQVTKVERSLTAEELGNVFYVRAKYYMLKYNDEPSLESIQALLFLSLREGGRGRANQAAAYHSALCRMIIDMGLHRQRDFSAALGISFTHEEEQARRRLFWCCFIHDKTSAAAMGRPPLLRDVEVDCPLPNVDEYDEHKVWVNMPLVRHFVLGSSYDRFKTTRIGAMSNLRCGIKLVQILERIITMYNTVRDKLDPDQHPESWEKTVLQIHNMLEEWERSRPAHIRCEVRSQQLPNVLCHHAWFQALKVILHRPYILKTPTLPGMPSSHQVCTEAVGKICDILTIYEENYGLKWISATLIYCIFTACTIEIANTTSKDVAVSAEAKRRLRKCMGWLSAMSSTWKSASHHLQILEQLGHGIDADVDFSDFRRGSQAASEKRPSEQISYAKPEYPLSSSSQLNDSNNRFVGSQPGMLVGPNSVGFIAGMPVSASSNPGHDNKDSKSPSAVPVQVDLPRNSVQISTNGTSSMVNDFKPPYIYNFNGRQANNGQISTTTTTTGQGSISVTGNPNDNSHTVAGFSRGSYNVGLLPQTKPQETKVDSSSAIPDSQAYHKLHDISYWGAMPLSSEDLLSWANFTNMYFEALNGVAPPVVDMQGLNHTEASVNTPSINGNVAFPSTAASIQNGLAHQGTPMTMHSSMVKSPDSVVFCPNP